MVQSLLDANACKAVPYAGVLAPPWLRASRLFTVTLVVSDLSCCQLHLRKFPYHVAQESPSRDVKINVTWALSRRDMPVTVLEDKANYDGMTPMLIAASKGHTQLLGGVDHGHECLDF